MRVGFLGNGGMGAGMARNLLKAGHQVAVWNRSAAAAEVLRADGAEVTARPRDVAGAEVVITMLADDRAVEDVALAPEFVAALRHDDGWAAASSLSSADYESGLVS